MHHDDKFLVLEMRETLKKIDISVANDLTATQRDETDDPNADVNPLNTNDENNPFFNETISPNEVESALKSLKSGRVNGSDGIGPEFYPHSLTTALKGFLFDLQYLNSQLATVMVLTFTAVVLKYTVLQDFCRCKNKIDSSPRHRLCGLAVRHSLTDREVRGSIPGRVKPRTLKLVSAADPPSVWHDGFSSKSGRPGVRIIRLGLVYASAHYITVWQHAFNCPKRRL
ncbi:hypothetical protein ElyMa_000778400 [Elysia marginata]|uniref:Uncharacterized protein n=1 Tax=Elysia marginata TaxID=1093978 RepID=A0AAV4GU35_9GAST|nr:hypothetical protein ElyMa_000778400 [Elysia marginata]